MLGYAWYPLYYFILFFYLFIFFFYVIYLFFFFKYSFYLFLFFEYLPSPGSSPRAGVNRPFFPFNAHKKFLCATALPIFPTPHDATHRHRIGLL